MYGKHRTFLNGITVVKKRLDTPITWHAQLELTERLILSLHKKKATDPLDETCVQQHEGKLRLGALTPVPRIDHSAVMRGAAVVSRCS